MNNSLVIETLSIDMDSEPDTTPLLHKKEEELTSILEAVEHIKASSYWLLLQDKVFNGVVDSLQNRLRSEKNPTEIYRLQGQIVWAEKYTDLDKLAQAYRNELSNIRNKLNA